MFSGILMIVIAIALVAYSIVKIKSMTRYYFIVNMVLATISLVGGIILIVMS